MIAPPLFGFAAPFGEALVILWIASLSYGAHTFLTVVQETAAGCDHMDWPSDPWTDRLASFFHLAALSAVWLGPVFFLAWGGFLNLSPQALVLIVVGYLWLLFPISLLSSLSAPSRLVILRLSVVRRLFWHAPTLLGYYLATALVLSLSLSVFGLAIIMGRLEAPEVAEIDFISVLYDWTLWVGLVLLLPFAAVVAAVGLLIYARLLGRLGWVLNLSETEEPSAPSQQAIAAKAGASPGQPSAAELPTQAFAPVAALAEDAAVYSVLTEDQPPSLPAPSPALGAQDVFVALPPDSASRQKAALVMRQTVPSRLELRLSRTTTVPPPPRWPLWNAVYTFPFYRSNLRQLLALSLGNLVVGAVLYLVVRWLPF